MLTPNTKKVKECNLSKHIEYKEVEKVMDMDKLLELKNIEYDQLDKGMLPDLSSVTVDTSVTIKERIQFYCDAIKNPYFLKVEKTIVKVEFIQERGTIENKVEEYLKSTKFQ